MDHETAVTRLSSLSPEDRLRLRRMLGGPRLHGYQQVARVLADQGIQRLSGVSGLPAYGMLGESARLGIRVLGTRRQFTATVMAAVDNYLSGRLVHAVYVSAGPGVTESMTGILSAHENNMPLLVLACRRSATSQLKGDFQELEGLPLMASITKWATMIEGPGDIRTVLQRACELAVSNIPGPVYVELPEDVLEASTDGESLVNATNYPPSAGAPDSGLVNQIHQLIELSQRPLLCLGEDLRWGFAGDLLDKLVSTFRLPFITTPMGRGLLPDDHELCANAARRKIIHRADLFILAGAWFDWRLRRGSELAGDCRIVHLHPDPDLLGRNVSPDVACLGQPMPVIAELARRSPDNVPDRQAWVSTIGRFRRQRPSPLPESWTCRMGYLSPEILFSALRRHMVRNQILVEEGSIHLSLSQYYLESFAPFSRFDPGRNGCIGMGIPQAMGACLAQPDRPVLAIVGDTGFGMSAMELETAVRHGMNFVLVVTNNSGISGNHRQIQAFGSNYPERVTQFQEDLPYHRLASALRVPAWLVTDAIQLETALEAAFSEKGPACIHVRMDPETPFPATW